MQGNWCFRECAVSLKPKPKPKDIIPFEAGKSCIKLNTGPRMFYNWAGSYLTFQHLVKRNRRTTVQKKNQLTNESHHCSTCTTNYDRRGELRTLKLNLVGKTHIETNKRQKNQQVNGVSKRRKDKGQELLCRINKERVFISTWKTSHT